MNLEIEVAFLIIFPFLGGILLFFTGNSHGGQEISSDAGKKREKLQYSIVIGTAVLEFICAWMLAVFAFESMGYKGLQQAPELTVPGVCGLGLTFTIDGFRGVYVLVTAFMWMMAALLSGEYMAHHHKRSRVYVFLLWTQGATMGVFLSADLYTTFLFFEVMSFTSYVWVVQEENQSALRAGATYLAVAVTGGLVLLMGIFLLYHELGTLAVGELYAAAAGCSDKGVLYAAGACMLFGFGAKAGAFPLHIWLPKAHPAAPAPASALLSGILTKTGIYGILILSCMIFRHDVLWARAVLGIGVITMFAGALLAVFSIDLKRTLACSSMSQIGFILTGIGMQGLLGEENSLAVHGTFLHMVNHSLIKLVLFLAAGVIYMNTHSLDLNHIRGYGRRKPLLAGAFLTGALAIGGIPFFGGYISKTLLHESILECGGGVLIKAVEYIFLFSGGMTVAYMAKLFAAIFLEKNEDTDLQEKYDARSRCMSPASALALAISAVVLFVWGLFPQNMEGAARLSRNFMGLTAEIEPISYFSPGNLRGGMISIGIGALLYFFFIRRFLLRGNEGGGREYVNAWPKWLDLEELLYRPVLLGALPAVCGVMCRILDSFADMAVVFLRKTLYRDSPLPFERPEGNGFTAAIGTVLNALQSLGNRTWQRKRPLHRDYVHLAALKNEQFKETNHIIQRSLSFGLLLFCIGLSLTLLYIIWW